jgi:putrescine aminotransferase
MPPTESLTGFDRPRLIHPLTDHLELVGAGGPLVLVEGDGSEVITDRGVRMLDGSAGLWTVNLGYGRRELIDAAKRQMETLPYASTFGGVASAPALELADQIVALTPRGLGGVFFTSGGSEANETAIKLARRFWIRRGHVDKSILVAHDRGYHGLAGVTTTATRLEPYHTDFGPPAPLIAEVPAPYLYRCAGGVPCDPATCPVCTGAVLEARINELGADRIAAVIVEPVFGSGGVIVPPPGYLRRVRELCDRHALLLIADEVITGFGRTGRWFGVEHDDVVPDMMTFAKGVTSGYVPLGGVVISDELCDELTGSSGQPGVLMHGFTHSGHPVACAVAIANIAVLMNDDLVQQVERSGAHLAELLHPLLDLPEVGDVRSRGLMAGIELVRDRETRERWPVEAHRGRRAIAAARDRGLLTRALLDDVLLLAPPFVITDQQLARAVEILADSIIATRGDAEDRVVP